MNDKDLMQRAVDLACESVAQGGEPFGAILVQDGKILAQAMNQAHLDHDPTAHAEIQALRIASREHARFSHPGSVMYASGKPCPMCMAAMVNAGVERVVFCADDEVGGPFGYSTEAGYARMQQQFGAQGATVEHLPIEDQTKPFTLYAAKNPA